MSFDPKNPCRGYDIKNPSDVSAFFELETGHMPLPGYANKTYALEERFNACAVIKQYGHNTGCNPAVPFLAISYYDNFISRRDIPVINAEDSFENKGIFILSCFFLAWKMIYPDECDLIEFLKKLDSDFPTNDVNAMQHEIDRWLESRSCKRPITSLTFLDYFISHLVNVDEACLALIRDFATDKAYAQQENIKCTEYKPSILAATAIIRSCELVDDSRYNTLASPIFASEYLSTPNLARALDVAPQTVQKSRQIPDFDDHPYFYESVGTSSSSPRSTTVRPDIPQLSGSVDVSSSSLLGDVASSSSSTQPPHDDAPASAFDITRVPRRYHDVAPCSSPQGSVYDEDEPIDIADVAALLDLDFLDFSTEDSSIQNADTISSAATPHPRVTESHGSIGPIASGDQTVVAAAEDSSIQNADTKSSAAADPATPHPRVTESDDSIAPSVSGDQTVVVGAKSRPGITNPFGNVCRPKERRSTI